MPHRKRTFFESSALTDKAKQWQIIRQKVKETVHETLNRIDRV